MNQNSVAIVKSQHDVKKWIVARYGEDVLGDVTLIDDKAHAFVGIASTVDSSRHYSVYEMNIIDGDVGDDGMLDYDENWDKSLEMSNILFLESF